MPNIRSYCSISKIGEVIETGFIGARNRSSAYPAAPQNCAQLFESLFDFSKESSLPIIPCFIGEGPNHLDYIARELHEGLVDGRISFCAIMNPLASAFFLKNETSTLSSKWHNLGAGDCYLIYARDSSSLDSAGSIIEELISHHVRPYFIIKKVNITSDRVMQRIDCKVISDLARDLLGTDTWIPFERQARLRKFPEAFSDLAGFF